MIREPSTPEDIEAVHQVMMMHAVEAAPVAVDPDRVMAKLLTACDEPDTHHILMSVIDGRLAGYLCLEEVPYWYGSGARMLTDFGFFVLPLFRAADVGPALLTEARSIAERKKLPLYVTINNPTRRRGARGQLERAASIIGFAPVGSVLRHER